MFNIGIIGGGINSAVGKSHLSAIMLLQNMFKIVTASFSRHSLINEKTNEQIGLKSDKIYNDYKKMINENKGIIDIIVVLTPTDQHHEQVIYALRNHISVICEKALTDSLDKAILIKKSLEKSKAELYVIYNYLGYPMIKELRHMIESGTFGKIFSIHIEMPQEGYIKNIEGKPVVPQDWRLNQKNHISYLSLDLGVHLHMFIKYLINKEPIRVVATQKSFGNFDKIDDDVNAIIEYSDNVVCNMWYSKSAIGYRNGQKIRIFGSEGSGTWTQMNPEILNFSDNYGNSFVIDRNSPEIKIAKLEKYNIFKGGHPIGFTEALRNYYFDIYQKHKQRKTSIKSDVKEVFGFEEAYNGLKLFHSISSSMIEKKWIDI